MPRIVRCSLIQATNVEPADRSLDQIKKAMIDKHVAMIRQAATAGAQIACLQEIFYGPYFCAEQATRWYDFTEPVPDGPTIQLMQALAKELKLALVVPVYEIETEGLGIMAKDMGVECWGLPDLEIGHAPQTSGKSETSGRSSLRFISVVFYRGSRRYYGQPSPGVRRGAVASV